MSEERMITCMDCELGCGVSFFGQGKIPPNCKKFKKKETQSENVDYMLHILRNPLDHNAIEIKDAQLEACYLIEDLIRKTESLARAIGNINFPLDVKDIIIAFEKSTGKKPNTVYLGEKECQYLKRLFTADIDNGITVCRPKEFMGLKVIEVKEDSFMDVG